jgi:hypothetical protein
MELDTKDIGRMIYNTATERKSGLITQNMKVNTLRVKSTEKVPTFGPTVACMKGTGLKIE